MYKSYMYMWVGVGGFSKVVATFNHVDYITHSYMYMVCSNVHPFLHLILNHLSSLSYSFSNSIPILALVDWGN